MIISIQIFIGRMGILILNAKSYLHILTNVKVQRATNESFICSNDVQSAARDLSKGQVCMYKIT